jgi:dUTPase
MSVQVKLLSTSARTPKPNNDGSYDIYSSEEIVIKPGETTNIRTGSIISLPLGYYGMIESTELVVSKNIETSHFGSMHYHNSRFSKDSSGNIVNFRTIELILTLRNLGLTKHLIQIGDVIGKLVVLRTRNFPVRQVDEIEEETVNEFEEEIKLHNDDPNKIVYQQSKMKTLSNTYSIWFKKSYREDPAEITKKYLTNEMIKQIEEFKKTEMYEEAMNKINVEANFVWKILDDATKIAIESDFVQNKKETFEKEVKKDEKKNEKEVKRDEKKNEKEVKKDEKIVKLEKKNENEKKPVPFSPIRPAAQKSIRPVIKDNCDEDDFDDFDEVCAPPVFPKKIALKPIKKPNKKPIMKDEFDDESDEDFEEEDIKPVIRTNTNKKSPSKPIR